MAADGTPPLLRHRTCSLSPAMRDQLWRFAQHMYGWGYVPASRVPTCLALERRGLVERSSWDKPHQPAFELTEAARPEIESRWPVCPWLRGSYEHEDWETWTPRDAPALMLDGMHEYIPGVPCSGCGRFVGRDGSIYVEHFEMSSEIASVDGTCARCLNRDTTEAAA